MGFNIVLIEPEIPMNTGNIGRLSLATGAQLHLVRPLGFELSDKRVKRAGLDYWKHVDLHIYEDINEFLATHGDKPMAFFSSHGHSTYWDIDFTSEMFLVFGKESKGLPSSLTEANPKEVYQIPLYSDHIRSLNLANAVSVVVYEGLRSLQQLS